MNDYIKVGKIINTHGIKGELRILSNFQYKDRIFKPNITLYIGENKIPEIIKTYRHHKDYEMVTFNNYNNINEVLKYLKSNVYIKREDLVLNDNEYILEDLIGKNITENNQILGKVKEIVYNHNNILLYCVGKKNFYIPIKGNYIKEVKDNIITKGAKDLIL